jgi:hypothetical protein
MRCLAAAMIFASFAHAQTAPTNEIAAAAKSPIALARYVEAHSSALDWDALWNALGTPAPKTLYPLCGDQSIDNGYRCFTEIVSVVDPDQSILVVESSGVRSHDVYIRYLQDAQGGWRFAGVQTAVLYDNYLRRHEVERIGE